MGKLVRRQDETAARINELHDEFLGAARATLMIGIRIGGLLAARKTELGHGAWLPWCRANLHFTERTASNYLRLWKHRAELKSEPGSLTAGYLAIGARKPRALPVRLDPEAALIAEARALPFSHRLRMAALIVFRRG
jgi:hypothetical protein